MSATVLADLAAELEVPANGTLSRVLHQDDQLRVVGFAFAEGEKLTEHASARPVVIQVVHGRLELGLADDQVVTATPATWVHLPAKLPHTVRALEPSVMLLTMLPDISS